MSFYESYQKKLLEDKSLMSYIASFRKQTWVGDKNTLNALGDALSRLYGLSPLEISRYSAALNSLMTSRRAKMKRIEAKIQGWLDRGIVDFITLTWNDAALKNNSFENRKKRIRYVLNQTCDDFIANIDFGDKNGREHYHAITLNCCDLELAALQKDFGFICVECVNDNTSKLVEYLDKLRNHALKESAGFGKNLIYCRKRPKK